MVRVPGFFRAFFGVLGFRVLGFRVFGVLGLFQGFLGCLSGAFGGLFRGSGLVRAFQGSLGFRAF